MPRHRRSELRAEGGAPKRPTGGGALTRLLAALLVAASASAVQAQPSRILVVPFDNVKREGRIFWLGEASAVLLTDDLNAVGADAITRPERQQAFERLQVPPVAALTDATVIRIGQLVGAARVVVGSLQMEESVLVVRARSIALETGRVQVDVTERGPLPDLFAIFERIARRITPSSSSASDIARQHPPVAVFEDYIKGLLAETPATAVNYLKSALKRQPSFDRARLALWEVFAEQSDHEQALAAVVLIPAASPWARRAQFLAGVSQLHLKKYDEAFTTFRTLADAQPTPTVLNNLGVVQLRRGATQQSGLPTYYFTKAAEADPGDADYVFNLGYAYWENRDPPAAVYWLREAVRRRPADGDAHFVLAAALSAVGNTGESTRERELARRLSSAYEEMARRPGGDVVPKGLERVKNEVELPHARLETVLAANEQRDQAQLAKFHLDRGRRLFQQENDRDAAVELNHALYLSPYLAEGHLLLGRIHLRNGRIAEAIGAFKIAVWSAESAEAHAALGEAYRQGRDLVSARAEADRALALDPESKDARLLIAKLEGR
jgi:tetratricopeptide (TPR) repeat protein